MTLPSFMKHVRTLETNGLIRTTKAGRVRTCVLNRERLALVDDWLAEQRRIWEERTDRLERFVTDTTEGQPMNPDLDLTLQRVIRAPRTTVWRAWTDPSQLEQWWVPAPTVARVDRLEVRPGGAFVTRMSDDGVEFVPAPRRDRSSSSTSSSGSRSRTRSTASGARRTPTRSRWSPRSSSTTTRRAPTTGSSSATAIPPLARATRRLGFFDGWGSVTEQLAALVEKAAAQ